LKALLSQKVRHFLDAALKSDLLRAQLIWPDDYG